MPKKKATPQDSTDNRELSTARSYMTMDKEAFLLYPEREEWRNRLIFTMEKWLERTECLEAQSFCYDYKIPYSTFNDWIHKYEDIGSAYTNLKMTLALRRRELSMRNKINGTWAYRDMHRLDPQWGPQVDKYHAEMKKEEDQQPTKFVIIADRPKVVSKDEMKGITDGTV